MLIFKLVPSEGRGLERLVVLLLEMRRKLLAFLKGFPHSLLLLTLVRMSGNLLKCRGRLSLLGMGSKTVRRVILLLPLHLLGEHACLLITLWKLLAVRSLLISEGLVSSWTDVHLLKVLTQWVCTHRLVRIVLRVPLIHLRALHIAFLWRTEGRHLSLKLLLVYKLLMLLRS